MKNMSLSASSIATLVLTSLLASCMPEKIDRPSEANLPVAAEYNDNVKIEVDNENNTVNFSFDGKGVTPVWVINGSQYYKSFNLSKYYYKEGEYTVDLKVSDFNGVSKDAISKTFNISESKYNGFAGYNPDSEYNLWKIAEVADPALYYAPGWQQLGNPSWRLNNGAYMLNLPAATSEQWQCQVLLDTDIQTIQNKQYDFSLVLFSSKDHPGVTVKLTDKTDDALTYFVEKVDLKANTTNCFYKSGFPGKNIANIKLVLDFGGNISDSEVAIDRIVLKEHFNDDGTVLPNV